VTRESLKDVLLWYKLTFIVLVKSFSKPVTASSYVFSIIVTSN